MGEDPQVDFLTTQIAFNPLRVLTSCSTTVLEHIHVTVPKFAFPQLSKTIFGVGLFQHLSSRLSNNAMICPESLSFYRSSIFKSVLSPDCFSNNVREKSGIPVE